MTYADLAVGGPDRVGRALGLVTRLCVPVAAACVVGMLVDQRDLLGEPVWVKPFKFAVSIGLAGAATAWLRARLPRSRAADVATVLVIVSLVVEQALISLQAARGVRSHFNLATPFDGALYGAMGVFVAVATGGLVVLALQATRRSTGDRVVDAVARWGCWLVVGGAAVGGALVAANAHTVGRPDGGPGLPLVGWSTVSGDLRTGHFAGLHGLQLLIVLAAWARRRGVPEPGLLTAIRAVGLGVAVLAGALTLQALARQPVTSASSLLVAGVVVGAAGAVVRRDRRGAAPAPAEWAEVR